MADSIYKLMGNQSGSLVDRAAMMEQFNQFRNSFTGDPKQMVQQLLNSGRMSQAQFNQLQAMAKQFQAMMK